MVCAYLVNHATKRIDIACECRPRALRFSCLLVSIITVSLNKQLWRFISYGASIRRGRGRQTEHFKRFDRSDETKVTKSSNSFGSDQYIALKNSPVNHA
jgi:hypothetical protein